MSLHLHTSLVGFSQVVCSLLAAHLFHTAPETPLCGHLVPVLSFPTVTWVSPARSKASGASFSV